MKIKGTEGLSVENIRDEVDRGARFVIYNYCISIVVMTFKRGSPIYFVKPGASRFVPGLPFTLISLVGGWWGFPWGPIYTIECLVRNLGGGTDVTNALMESLAPGSNVATPPELPLTGSAPAPRPTSRTSFTRKQVLVGSSLLLAILAAIYAAVCFGLGQKRDAVLLSGLDKPYRVEVNGTAYQLPPYGVVKLEVPEGDVVLSGAGLGKQVVHVETPFWTRPFDPQAVILNPDRAGLWLQHGVTYYSDNSGKPSENSDEAYTLHANQAVYIVPKPDYFFVDAPQTISMPSSASSVTKQRMTELRIAAPLERAQLVRKQLGASAASEFVKQLTQLHPSEEDVLSVVPVVLTRDETITLFETRLAERPVLVEWHRAYQSICQNWGRNKTLVETYAKMAAAEPANGVLLYLQGRIEKDDARALDFYERALKAPQPCLHAHLGIAHREFAAANFEAALQHYQKVEDAGLALASARLGKEASLMGLGRYDEILVAAKKRRLANPRDLNAAVGELQAIALKTPTHEAVDAALKETVQRFASFPDSSAQEKAEARAYLEAHAAYALGEEDVFAAKLQKIDNPYLKFLAAVAQRDVAAAELALKKEDDTPSTTHLILYLTALGAGDTLGAEQYWNRARQAMSKEPEEYETLARFLSGERALTPEQICHLDFGVSEKRIVLTALGAHDPEHRAVYHSFAAKLNHSPEFPHLLLNAALNTPTYGRPVNVSGSTSGRVF